MRTDLELIYDWVPHGARILDRPAATARCWSGWPTRNRSPVTGWRSTRRASPSVWPKGSA